MKKTVRKAKPRKKVKQSAKKPSASYQKSFLAFKKRIEVLFGKIDWKKVGTFVVAGLLVAGSMGAFGPQIKFLAFAVLSSLNMA